MKDKAAVIDSSGRKVSKVHDNAKKYSRGSVPEAVSSSKKGLALQTLLTSNVNNIREAAEKAAEVEVLLPAERGFIELEEPHMRTFKLKQKDIIRNVDVNTAQKAFDLHLTSFGPYFLNYTRNGRHMLLGGRRGHVATFDCHTMNVGTELQLQQEIFDVQYLHNETLFAVAQSKYTYIYDQHGVEIHCMKKHTRPYRLEYLPYHFLLASVGAAGSVKWHDVSTGELAGSHNTSMGACSVMKANPANAVLHLGHGNGVVSLWSPSVGKALASVFTHACPVADLAIDRQGVYMATAGMDGLLKIWDLRTLTTLHTYTLKAPAQHVDISESGLLAVSMGRSVEVMQHAFTRHHGGVTYLGHELSPPPRSTIRGQGAAASKQSLASSMAVSSLRFRPLEDILGIGHSHGFTSIIVPGSGEANFDTFENNPFVSSKQRREAEVHQLLNKLSPEMIALEANGIGAVESKEDANKLRAEQIALYAPKEAAAKKQKNRKRGRNKISAKLKRKQQNVVDEQVAKAREAKKERSAAAAAGQAKQEAVQLGALARFKN